LPSAVVNCLPSTNHDLNRLSATARHILRLAKCWVYAGIVPRALAKADDNPAPTTPLSYTGRPEDFFSPSLKTREGSGLILRQSEDFVQADHPENLRHLFCGSKDSEFATFFFQRRKGVDQ